MGGYEKECTNRIYDAHDDFIYKPGEEQEDAYSDVMDINQEYKIEDESNHNASERKMKVARDSLYS